MCGNAGMWKVMVVIDLVCVGLDDADGVDAFGIGS